MLSAFQNVPLYCKILERTVPSSLSLSLSLSLRSFRSFVVMWWEVFLKWLRPIPWCLWSYCSGRHRVTATSWLRATARWRGKSEPQNMMSWWCNWNTVLATPTRELRLMSTVWTREQEEELAELFQRYKGEQGEREREREGGRYM